MYTVLKATRRDHRRPAPAIRTALAALAANTILALAGCTGASPATGSGTAVAGGETKSPAEQSQASAGPDQSTGSGSLTLPDPCSLMTADELKAQLNRDFAVGVLDPMSAASGRAGVGRSFCTWNPPKSDALYTATLVVYANVAGFEADRPPTAKPASGIGDDAYLVLGSGAGANNSVSFKKGPWYLVLNMSGADWQPTETQMTAVAKLAASRL